MPLEAKHMWMGLPVLLLLMSLSIGVTAFVVSSRGSAAEEERDYYQRGMRWDDHQDALAKSRNLGWTARFDPDGIPALGEEIDVRFHLTDGDGQPVSGATGSMRAFFNADAHNIFEGPVDAPEPGVYRFRLTPHRGGVWRWELVLELYLAITLELALESADDI